jgi:hypothetical protein
MSSQEWRRDLSDVRHPECPELLPRHCSHLTPQRAVPAGTLPHRMLHATRHVVRCTPRVMLYVARHASHNVRFQLARNHAAVRRCARHTDRRVYSNQTSNHARVVSKAIAIATLQSPESALRFASSRLQTCALGLGKLVGHLEPQRDCTP